MMWWKNPETGRKRIPSILALKKPGHYRDE
jgi:hypothetical protein